MKLYIVRHGQTNWNIERKVQGRVDIPLNSTGIKQAEETRDKLKDDKIDLILCSPLKRAIETAKIINLNRNVPIIYDNKIIERDFGEFEGLKKESFDFLGVWSYKKNLHFEKVENIKEFFDRIYLRLDEIKSEYQDKNILIVTHGGVSIPVDCYFNGIPDDDNLLSRCLKNCEVKSYNVL